MSGIDSYLWEGGVLNVMDSSDYLDKEIFFLNWVSAFYSKRILLVSHDGTINTYRERLTRKILTRKDFLDETNHIKFDFD